MMYIVFSAAVLFWVTSALASIKPPVYPNWPACKMTVEWVLVIPKDERVVGTQYHQRNTSSNRVRSYLCRPCTQCVSGVQVIAPCSVHSDMECSTTECAINGCVLEGALGCRLPGDPNDFKDKGEMMDPCDPTVTKNTTAAIPSNLVRPTQEIDEVLAVHSSNDDRSWPIEEVADSSSPSDAPAGIQTIIFGSLIGFLFIATGGIIIHIVYQNHDKGRGQVTQRSNKIQMADLANSGCPV